MNPVYRHIGLCLGIVLILFGVKAFVKQVWYNPIHLHSYDFTATRWIVTPLCLIAELY